MKKIEFKILCSSHQACPEVMGKLQELQFEAIQDSPQSPSYDISCRRIISDDKEMRGLAQKLFTDCNGKVKEIRVTYT